MCLHFYYFLTCILSVSINSAFNILKPYRSQWLGGQVTWFMGFVSAHDTKKRFFMIFSFNFVVSRITLYKEP